MQKKNWKVGELSKLTGVTIRTLHHYDEIGLLCPMLHTDAGHRLYSESDIVKLQQIMSLKELDFSLDEIKEFFEGTGYDPKDVLKAHLERINEELKLKEELRRQLQEIQEVFDLWQSPAADQFIKAIELIRNQKKYFTKEQCVHLKKQYDRFNTPEAKEFTDSWSKLISMIQFEMEEGTQSNDPKVVELAKGWQEGIKLFTGGDMGIIKAAEHYYMDNPQAAKESGMSGELYRYIMQALSNV